MLKLWRHTNEQIRIGDETTITNLGISKDEDGNPIVKIMVDAPDHIKVQLSEEFDQLRKAR